MGIALQRLPLLGEDILEVFTEKDLFAQPASPIGERLRIPVEKPLPPVHPDFSPEGGLEGHKQGIVFQPEGILLAEGEKAFGLPLGQFFLYF
jgi:hypothetical protein